MEAVGNSTKVQLLWKTVWRFLQSLNLELPHDTAIEHLFEKVRTVQCSEQHYLQPPARGRRPSAYLQVTGLRDGHVHNGALLSHKKNKIRIHHLQQRG